jgi:allophanate hydrolase
MILSDAGILFVVGGATALRPAGRRLLFCDAPANTIQRRACSGSAGEWRRSPTLREDSMPAAPESLDLAQLRRAYLSGTLRPRDLVARVLARIERSGDDKVWIDRVPREQLDARAAQLEQSPAAGLPLYGIPFAIKDNIDLAGRPTTAACPDFAYTPDTSAPVVQKLVDAGAIAIGKTNLDQFATGLVGTRSPYGACSNPFDGRYIAGGSSSGSAVAVATGLVSFSLGTDTAGSGRVPAAFNNIIGLKPTLGLLSTRGVVPACRTLDCVSVFSLTADDAQTVLAAAQGFDSDDPYSRARPEAPPAFGERFRFGVPRKPELEFFGDREYEELFAAAVARLEALGGERTDVDFAPFLETARLLYEGPWLAERWLVIRDLLSRRPEAVHPVTRRVIESAAGLSAADAFAASYRLKALRRQTEAEWNRADILVTPSAGTIYTLSQVEADPVALNSRLGYYTNFVNLLDLSAIALPAGFRGDGLPFGITLLAPAFHDDALCALGARVQRSFALTLGATGCPLPSDDTPRAPARRPGTVRVAVCGAHMSGLPLNRELTERGARLVSRGRTAPCYRLYALEAFSPPRPGMVRGERGAAIEVEVWELPAAQFGGFVDRIPAPLGIGTVELEDGEQVRGFLCEHYATAEAREITELGSWRTYVARQRRAGTNRPTEGG